MLEDSRPGAGVCVQQTQEDVLCADVFVVEAASFLIGQLHDLAGFAGKLCIHHHCTILGSPPLRAITSCCCPQAPHLKAPSPTPDPRPRSAPPRPCPTGSRSGGPLRGRRDPWDRRASAPCAAPSRPVS